MDIKGIFQLKQASTVIRNGGRARFAERVFATALFGAGIAASASAGTYSAGPQALPAAAAASSAAVAAGKCDSFLAAKIAALPKADASAVSGWTSVIVRLKDGALDAGREKSLKALGSDIYCRLSFIGSVAVRVPNRSLRELEALPFISHLSLDSSVRKNDEFVVEGSGAAGAYPDYALDGTGVGVVVMDSGIHGHPDLNTYDGSSSRVIIAKNFSAAGNAIDDCGHGTHIAGIIAGNGTASSNAKNFRTFYGIARNANLINVRVLDSTGQGTVSGVVSGINWVIKHKSAYNVRVLNLSLGHSVGDSYLNDPLCQAAEAAYKAGIVVVCAAGNNGRLNTYNVSGSANQGWGTSYGSIQSPANDPYVITVGAMKEGTGARTTDTIATYSSRGPSLIDGVLKPDIVAPGNRVISTLANGSYLDVLYGATNSLAISAYTTGNNANASKKYFYLSGTSMASPVVAGAAALLIQQDPTLTPDSVKARLMLTADKWANADGSYDACTYGAGYLDIPAALGNVVVPGSPVLSPKLSRDNVGHVIVDGSQSIWASSGTGVTTIWGIPGLGSLQSVWGNGSLINAQAVWNSQSILTTLIVNWVTVGGDQVLWGGSPGDGVTAPPPPSDSASVDLTSTAVQGE